MTRHVSAERLARFREADLGRAAARRVAAHLAGCAACRAEFDALARLPGLLASTPVPQIPAHLAARIENALATESAHRAATSPSPAPAAARPGGGRPGRQRGSGAGRRPRLRVPALAGALAAVAVLVVAVSLGFSQLRRAGGTAGSSSASSGSFPASAPRGPGRQQAPAAGQAEPQARPAPVAGPAQRYVSGGHSGTFAPVRSATDYLPGQVARQAAGTLASVRAARPHPSFRPGTSGGPSQLAGCVGRIAAGHAVLLVDLASYQGSPATIIVTGPPGGDQAWVAGPSCSAQSSDLLARQSMP